MYSGLGRHVVRNSMYIAILGTKVALHGNHAVAVLSQMYCGVPGTVGVNTCRVPAICK